MKYNTIQYKETQKQGTHVNLTKLLTTQSQKALIEFELTPYCCSQSNVR